MALRERYIKDQNGDGTGTVLEESVYGNQNFQEMKARLHKAIITRLDLTKLNTLAPDRVKAEVSRLAEGLLQTESVPPPAAKKDRIVVKFHHEFFGLGPLEPLLADPTISDILVNSYANVFV